MEVRISKELAEAVGKKAFKPFGIGEESWNWRDNAAHIDLSRITTKQMDSLRALVTPYKQVRGVGVILRDMESWRRALADGAGGVKARTTKHFESLLRRFIIKVPGHRIYTRSDEAGDAYLCYYVSKTDYHPPETRSGYERPAYVSMSLVYEQFGGQSADSESFREEECRNLSVVDALAKKNYFAETEELRAQYLEETKRFVQIAPQVGKQFWASGTAVDDLDGNPRGRGDSWYWNRSHTIQMVHEGSPTRVAVDVYYEDDKSSRDRDRDVDLHTWFWEREIREFKREDDDDEDLSSVIEEPPVIEVPIHPLVAVFDFSKHLRLRIHVNYLKEYLYDKKMSEKLVLPDVLKSLVRMLIEHKGAAFKDIVRGKSGGAVVLLTGPPGTGKTLTAEVYAESEERALYSVQCSQLGTSPDDLEDELLKVFARARRWNAVMLLDEADVYVRERGTDLNQNAIVGVFLRVLEYQSSVLFLTTNRPEDVDDAIASRCIARIDYPVPEPEQQAQIWRVLAEASGIELSAATIKEIVAASRGITGRDVKNLLKLGQLVSASEGKKITAKSIEFVKQFKPTTKKEKP